MSLQYDTFSSQTKKFSLHLPSAYKSLCAVFTLLVIRTRNFYTYFYLHTERYRHKLKLFIKNSYLVYWNNKTRSITNINSSIYSFSFHVVTFGNDALKFNLC